MIMFVNWLLTMMIFFKHSINIDSSPDSPPFWFLSSKSPGKVGVQRRGNEVDVKICEISWRPQKGHFTHQGQKPFQAGSGQRGMLKRDKSISQHISWAWGWGLGSQQDCIGHLRPLPGGWMDGRACFSLPATSSASHYRRAFSAHLSIQTQPSVAFPKWWPLLRVCRTFQLGFQ